jgi:hypothetical protein
MALPLKLAALKTCCCIIKSVCSIHGRTTQLSPISLKTLLLGSNLLLAFGACPSVAGNMISRAYTTSAARHLRNSNRICTDGLSRPLQHLRKPMANSLTNCHTQQPHNMHVWLLTMMLVTLPTMLVSLQQSTLSRRQQL